MLSVYNFAIYELYKLVKHYRLCIILKFSIFFFNCYRIKLRCSFYRNCMKEHFYLFNSYKIISILCLVAVKFTKKRDTLLKSLPLSVCCQRYSCTCFLLCSVSFFFPQK